MPYKRDIKIENPNVCLDNSLELSSWYLVHYKKNQNSCTQVFRTWPRRAISRVISAQNASKAWYVDACCCFCRCCCSFCSCAFWAADPKGTMSYRTQGGISVRPSVRPSVPPSLRPSVPPSLRPSVDISQFLQCRVHFFTNYHHFWFVGLL